MFILDRIETDRGDSQVDESWFLNRHSCPNLFADDVAVTWKDAVTYLKDWKVDTTHIRRITLLTGTTDLGVRMALPPRSNSDLLFQPLPPHHPRRRAYKHYPMNPEMYIILISHAGVGLLNGFRTDSGLPSIRGGCSVHVHRGLRRRSFPKTRRHHYHQ